MSKKALFRFYADCGRQGDLEGVFISTKEMVNKLIDSKIEVYFGEVLGKHSEVYGSIEKKEIEFLTDDEVAVEVVSKYKLETGYNPFDYDTPEGESVYELVQNMLENKV